jgi:hypothetical protein
LPDGIIADLGRNIELSLDFQCPPLPNDDFDAGHALDYFADVVLLNIIGARVPYDPKTIIFDGLEMTHKVLHRHRHLLVNLLA